MNQKEINIAIVANMSAGKSTFINAMFGDDILPSSSQATTDCPIYIYSDDKPNSNIAVIEFSDNKDTKVLNNESVKKDLKKYAKKDSLVDDDKYKAVEKIDLYWQFYRLINKKSNNDYFVIIDTPGPNNRDEYGEKHNSITKNIILNEADMLLYIFDYTQIDANLEVTQNNIWGWIEKRKKINKKFDVYFIINKIDKALDDNNKLPAVVNSKTEEEYLLNLQTNWFYHEQKAINKIKLMAEKIGFNSSCVFVTSSEYQKLNRMKKLSFKDKKKLCAFQEIFQEVFKDDWTNKFNEYIELSWI
ncbi:MAG: GTP-binding protein Der [uncultured Sulfurovum sp.]|uniref:GTP-binding protein Der n=1 Tax=uncultured Sulfurovum sp. TaxID=269237 RepID=A0A6S6SSW4_9BACT|nr:MAG: GTP-binding protein Der [uncultured Sulfurovum sp.]